MPTLTFSTIYSITWSTNTGRSEIRRDSKRRSPRIRKITRTNAYISARGILIII